MSACPVFIDYAREVLNTREQTGTRGIAQERNRFAVHIETAPFANLELAAITKRDIRAWARAMQQKPARDNRGERKISTCTVKRAVALVSATFRAAVYDDLLENNPCRDLDLQKRTDEIGKDDPWTYLTLHEQHAIAASADIPLEHRLAIAVAIGTGMRQGEQFNLEWPDVHLDAANPYIRVRFGSKGKPPKNGKPRSVPLLPHALEALRAWRKLQPVWAPENPDNLVFPTKRGKRRGVGKPLGNGALLKQYLALVGITRRARWHDLRHSCASSLVSGMWGRRWTLEEIRPLMGHSSITITQRYAHLGDEELAAAARDTLCTHPPLPIVAAVNDTDAALPPANDTSPDLAVWWDEAVSA